MDLDYIILLKVLLKGKELNVKDLMDCYLSYDQVLVSLVKDDNMDCNLEKDQNLVFIKDFISNNNHFFAN